jgi:predicted permease
MEAPADDRQVAKQRLNSGGGVFGNSGNLGFDVRHSSESGSVVVAVMLMLFVCLLMPMMAMLYFDSLSCQKKAERTEARVEKLLKNLEDKK